MTIDCIEKYANGARNGTKSVYIFITLALSLKDDKSMVHDPESIRSCSRRKIKEYHGNLDVGATVASLSEQNADNLRWGIPDRPLVPACSRWEKSCKREWQRNPSPVTDLFERDIQPGDSFSCQFDIGVSRIKTNSRLWGWTIRRTAADGSTRECYFGENGLLESIAEATYKF